MRTLIASAALLVTGAASAAGSRPAGRIDFERDIAPIFEASCVRCHGPDRQSAGLRLDSRRHAALGGVSGQLILGGTTEINEIYRRVSSDDPAYRMPRFEDPLPDEQIGLIQRWVVAGTPWPATKLDLAAGVDVQIKLY